MLVKETVLLEVTVYVVVIGATENDKSVIAAVSYMRCADHQEHKL